jgi:hypothetical protein
MKIFSLVCLYNQHKFEKELEASLRVAEPAAAIESSNNEEDNSFI